MPANTVNYDGLTGAFGPACHDGYGCSYGFLGDNFGLYWIIYIYNNIYMQIMHLKDIGVQMQVTHILYFSTRCHYQLAQLS